MPAILQTTRLLRFADAVQRVRAPGARRAVAAMALVVGAMAAGASSTAWAQGASDPASELAAITQNWVDNALARDKSAGLPLRMEVSVGALDARLRLAPCARVEPYLPTGSRLWGRTRLGLRCVQGQTAWNVFLPVTVKAYGPAWILTNNVAQGTVLTADDAMETEVDWAANSAPVMANPDLWVGLVAARTLQAGQTLRQNMVRAPQLVRSGAEVKVLAQGAGFVISSAGQAMSGGSAGQTVRIRMSNGRIVTGTVSENGTVDIIL